MPLTDIDAQRLGDSVADKLGVRNLIINGAMTVAQRATSTSTILGGTNYTTLDRFKAQTAGYTTAAGTVSQSTEAPTGFSKSIRFNVTTPETISGGDLANIRYRVEAQDIQNLEYGTSQAKTTTLSFYVRSSITGTYGISVFQDDATRNLGLTYSVNTANTWEYKTLTIPGDTSGTINNDTGEGLQIAWNLSVGSTFKGTDNTTWGAYSNARWATGHAVDLVGVTSDFYLTGVQLEVGNTATPFEHRSFADELARCQRYFQKSYNYSVAPGTATTVGMLHLRKNSISSGITDFVIRLHPPMRANPTAVIYSTSDGASGNLRNETDTANVSAVANSPGENGFNVSTAALGAGKELRMQYTAEAEL